MKHRSTRLLDSARNTASAATKRLTLWFAEGCVESLVQISQMQQDAQEEENQELLIDIDNLLKDLGLREESKGN
jgi:hypothetical protein